jgi:hypothetical protein
VAFIPCPPFVYFALKAFQDSRTPFFAVEVPLVFNNWCIEELAFPNDLISGGSSRTFSLLKRTDENAGRFSDDGVDDGTVYDIPMTCLIGGALFNGGEVVIDSLTSILS